MIWREKITLSWFKIQVIEGLTILGDPGADSGNEGKSKRAEKYIWGLTYWG